MRRPFAITSCLLTFGFALSGCIGNCGQNIAQAKKIGSDRSVPTEDNHPGWLTATSSMPMWFYDQAREFRYPVPAEFDFAYIDRDGKILTIGPFICAESFYKGVAPVKPGRYAFANGRTRLKIDSPYRYSSLLMSKDGKTFGKPFRDILSFIDDYTVFKGNGESGVLDLHGNVVCTFQSYDCKHYSEGLIPVDTNNKWGFIDQRGHTVIESQFDDAEPFSEGMSVVRQTWYGSLRGQTNPVDMLSKPPGDHNRSGFIDKTGNIVVTCQYQQAGSFKGGLAAVKQDQKWGYIDKQGAAVIRCQYDFAGPFGCELAAVEKEGKVGFIDKHNKVIIPFQFADATVFSEGLAAATLDGRHWGFIDPSGKFVLQPVYLGAMPFSDGLALVYVVAKGDALATTAGASALLKEAKIARRSMEFDSAREGFRLVVANAPGSAEAKEAQTFLDTAFPKGSVPKNVLANYVKGCILSSSGHNSEAVAILEECIKECPGFDWAYGALGQILTAEKKYGDSDRILLQAVKNNPHYMRGYLRLSQNYAAQGKTEQAGELYKKAKALNPYDEVFSQPH